VIDRASVMGWTRLYYRWGKQLKRDEAEKLESP
jgi:hypothetical protein